MSKSPQKRENTTSHLSPKQKKAQKERKRYDKKKELLLALQTENITLKERIHQLEIENNLLLMENRELKSNMDISAMEFQIAKNTQTLLNALSEKSPNCKSLIYFFSQNLEKQQIMKYYGISKNTFYHSREEEGNYLIDQLYPVGIERNRVSEVCEKEIVKILDDILPIQSGRRY